LLAKVIRAFAALLGQVTNPVDAFFNTVEVNPRKTSILYWGINSVSTATSGTNPFPQSLYSFSTLVSPSANSSDLNLKCEAIDVEGTASGASNRYLFWINEQTNNLVVSNQSVNANQDTLVTSVTAPLVQWSPGTTETIRTFKASGLTANNNFRIIVVTTPQFSLTSRVYILTVSVNTSSVPSAITPLLITSATQIPDTETIRSVDMSVDGTRFLAVGDNTAIFYGTIAASVSVSRITISNVASFANESLERLNCVRFANRNNSANTNIVLSTSLSTTPRGGFCYYGSISGTSISLSRVDNRTIAPNLDIRSFSVANRDANSATSPTIIAVAVYNGPVIVYSTPAPTAQVPTPALYSTINVSEINGRWTSVSSIFSNSMFLLAACSDFPANSTNGSNDGRVIFSRNAGIDWFTLPNPSKYTSNGLSETDANRLNPFNPTTNARNDSYDKLFNAYNFNAVDLTVVGQNISIFASYDPAFTYNTTTSITTSTSDGTSCSGLLRINFVL